MKVYNPCHTRPKRRKIPPWAKKGNVVTTRVSKMGRLPIVAATAVPLKRLLDRLLRMRKRTASAIITPAIGAKNMVKNPSFGTIQLPIKDKKPATRKAIR
ncbi:MAG: hypothetical protein KAJ53_09870 [Anaerolineales bacterium]|nr:hypothetical protein [Anaerolineales bacterium]